ncbi:MAG: glycosyltransferase family 1 protein [Chloroflexaceae bacterium]|nr:glycosyltransferase family 1 protein [Chloroflexaceae bacterium]
MLRLESELLFTPIPEAIARLRDLAYNLWWVWHPEAQELFRQIDRELWEQTYHNPVSFLREVRQRRLDDVAANPTYMSQFHAVMSRFDAYMDARETWYTRHYPNGNHEKIAYFSAEFGIHESMPIYSGGLGILSGDHTKEASDMGLPLVAIGFLYPQGYFRQHLDHSGWQLAEYHKFDFANVAATPATTPDGGEVVVEVELPGRTIYAKVYRIQVGRVPLYLMDTDIHPNSPQDRELSARLYGGDREMRVSQEIVLGIGGVRALRKLGIHPTVWHMNEGHSAFLVLELTRELVAQGVPFAQAAERVTRSCIFTTHTPVPAGNDAFPFDMIERFFWQYWPQLGIDRNTFLELGRQDQHWGPTFAMTVLGLKFSSYRNGVSKLHGHVARGMWEWLYPGKSRDEVPITSVTNGVHSASWLAPELRALFDTHMGPDWEDHLDDPEQWKKIYEIPNDVFWGVKRTLRNRLVAFVRNRIRHRLERINQPPAPWQLLEEDALTIGFARRFATYKRASLIFKDIERLKSLLNRPGHPIQIIFAGKAHPADNPGKLLIQEIHHLSLQPGLAGRVVFLEEYDIAMARELVKGVDIWLNTPRRPYEASGTSGQKASLNGVPNFSVLDGWWPEAYNGRNGWAIGEEREFYSQDEQDWNDVQSLYHTLEQTILPLFYEQRDGAGVPHEWLNICKEAIVTVAPNFSFRRMLADYMREFYAPAIKDAETVGG